MKFATDVTAKTLHSNDLEGQIAALHRSQAVISFEANVRSSTRTRTSSPRWATPRRRSGPSPQLLRRCDERAGAEYKAFWQALGRGEYQSSEFRRIAKGGRDVFIQATYNPITDAEGRVVKIVKFATDISAAVAKRQRRAEAQRLIGEDLDKIGLAIEDVTHQTAEAAGTVSRVSDDLQAVAAGAEELSASVDEISQQVSSAAQMAGKAVAQAQHTGTIVSGLSEQASQIGDVITVISQIAGRRTCLRSTPRSRPRGRAPPARASPWSRAR